jgi:hypothetical protein
LFREVFSTRVRRALSCGLTFSANSTSAKPPGWSDHRVPVASVTVTREELFQQVWETPLVRLAVQYGVSNVALGKTCRRLNIPLPGRGYWARVAAGENVTRPPLPKATATQAWVRLARDPTAKPVGSKGDASVPQVTVAETLDGAHEVVRRVAALLPKARPDQHDRLSVGCLLVTLETHKRALLLLDGLCKAIHSRGHRASFGAATSGLRRSRQ